MFWVTSGMTRDRGVPKRILPLENLYLSAKQPIFYCTFLKRLSLGTMGIECLNMKSYHTQSVLKICGLIFFRQFNHCSTRRITSSNFLLFPEIKFKLKSLHFDFVQEIRDESPMVFNALKNQRLQAELEYVQSEQD